MGTLAGLAARLNNEADKLDDLANEASIFLAKTIAYKLIDDTPYDTSRAASNWLVNFGSRSNYATLEFAKGSHGSTRGTSSATAKRRVDNALAAKVPGQSIFISNVVRYIVYLNQGHSGQAPAMFVESAVQYGKVQLRRKLKSGGFRQ